MRNSKRNINDFIRIAKSDKYGDVLNLTEEDMLEMFKKYRADFLLEYSEAIRSLETFLELNFEEFKYSLKRYKDMELAVYDLEYNLICKFNDKYECVDWIFENIYDSKLDGDGRHPTIPKFKKYIESKIYTEAMDSIKPYEGYYFCNFYKPIDYIKERNNQT